MQDLLSAVGPNAKRGIRSQITIHKAAIKKGKLVADFSESLDNELAGRDFTVTCNDNAHADLQAAFKNLVPHFCLLTEQLSLSDIGDEDGAYVQPEAWWELENDATVRLLPFTVTGVTYGGSKEPGFTLVGAKLLGSGHVLNIVAPFLTFDETSHELETLLRALNEEVELGLRGKCAEAGRQLDMFQTDQPGFNLLNAAEDMRGALLLGPAVEDVEAEDVTDEDELDGCTLPAYEVAVWGMVKGPEGDPTMAPGANKSTFYRTREEATSAYESMTYEQCAEGDEESQDIVVGYTVSLEWVEAVGGLNRRSEMLDYRQVMKPQAGDEQPVSEEPAAGEQTSGEEPEQPKKRGRGRPPKNPKPQQ